MIKLYNTLSGELEEFKPIEENKVKMYVCGPTVYNYIHIGNSRPAIFFDTVRRYFEFKGYNVTYVQNFTDVDDKMINRANEEGITVKEVADKYIKAYFEDTSKINLKEEGMIRPKATDNIGGMIEIIKSLIDKGFAYESNGDVYFNVQKYKEVYGELSGQKIDELEAGARIKVMDQKESPLDFTLWKSAKEEEGISWGSPWGQGRPGWHIECSAMTKRYLGENFDIHGGGMDLIFPHHENEMAQSKCATGENYAKYWMHNGYINIKGEKMSKSLGNFFLLREVLEKYEGRYVRFFMLSSHYRKPIEFSSEELDQSKLAVERIENSLKKAIEKLEDEPKEGDDMQALFYKNALDSAKTKFEESMDSDFNTAGAIGAIFELVKSLNKFLDSDSYTPLGKELLNETIDFVKVVLEDILGVKLQLEKEVGNLTKDLIEFVLDLRRDLRKEKNFAMSDKIRDRLKELGITIKDGRDKTTWSI